jgi:hypothetical protein
MKKLHMLPLRSVGHGQIGPGWFAILYVSESITFWRDPETCSNRSLQAFVILGVLHTLATDAIEMHRFQVKDYAYETS